jgi:dual specificity tyrosine-phosphorylation-regulated kinase 1
MTDHFEHRKHLCLVFELLSFNLYDLIKKSKSLSLNLIRKISYQLLNSLHFLSPAGVDIIHSDLKPENILLRDPNRSGVKIIDFGSSCRRSEQIFTYIQSRFYRAPEILLGLDYDQSIDMWSIGCILMELHSGIPLFPGADSPDQMRLITQFTGIPPLSMLLESSNTQKYFELLPDGSYQVLPQLVRSWLLGW